MVLSFWLAALIGVVFKMNHQTDMAYVEYKIRLDAALDALTLASARLKDVIFIGPDEAVDSALARLRFARFRFLEARADYREAQLTL